MHQNIIFLDVDGVLNNGTWAMEMYERGIHVYRNDILYEPALERLKRLVETTGAKLVISSAWRQIPVAYGHLKEWLAKYSMAVYDKTPYVGGCRGDDITSWFYRNPGDYNYVILDDEDDMGIHKGRLVRTDFDRGLTDEDVEKACRILKDGILEENKTE